MNPAALRARRAQVMCGLTEEQRKWVRAYLPPPSKLHVGHSFGEHVDGWSIHRAPTTIHPPTTLRLYWREPSGRLASVISITENGMTREFPTRQTV